MAFKRNSGKLKSENHYAKVRIRSDGGNRKDSLCKKKKRKK